MNKHISQFVFHLNRGYQQQSLREGIGSKFPMAFLIPWNDWCDRLSHQQIQNIHGHKNINQPYMYWILCVFHQADLCTNMMFSWIFIFWLLQILKFVSAIVFNISRCYYIITEEFHHEGDIVIGAFFPLHTFYTGKKMPHPTLPYQYLDNYIQWVQLFIFWVQNSYGLDGIVIKIYILFIFFNKFTVRDSKIFSSILFSF